MSKKQKKERYETPNEVMLRDSEYPHNVIYDDVVHTRFKPMGFGHELQKLMVGLLHAIAMDKSTMFGEPMTLNEIGFLHQISILYEEGRVKMRMYFAPQLASEEHQSANGHVENVPIRWFLRLNRYFFVVQDNDLSGVTGFEKIVAPKYKIEYDELGRPAVKLKKDGSDMKLQEVMYIDCNLPITIAACLGISLADPNFKVSIETVGQTADKKKRIIIDGKENSYPIWINVEHSVNPHSYDPVEVIPYLIGLTEKRQTRYKEQKKLAEKAADDSEKKSKKKNKNKCKYL